MRVYGNVYIVLLLYSIISATVLLKLNCEKIYSERISSISVASAATHATSLNLSLMPALVSH